MAAYAVLRLMRGFNGSHLRGLDRVNRNDSRLLSEGPDMSNHEGVSKGV